MLTLAPDFFFMPKLSVVFLSIRTWEQPRETASRPGQTGSTFSWLIQGHPSWTLCTCPIYHRSRTYMEWWYVGTGQTKA